MKLGDILGCLCVALMSLASLAFLITVFVFALGTAKVKCLKDLKKHTDTCWVELR